MRTSLAIIAAASLLVIAACGDDETSSPGTLPPTTEPPTTEPLTTDPPTTDPGGPPATDNRPITIDDVEIDPDGAPAGPLFGSRTESDVEPADVQGVCPTEGDCEPDVVEPIDPFVPLPEHEPFCTLLDDMSQRPLPDDEFQEIVVVQAWFGELRAVAPNEITQPFDVVIAFVDDIVAAQSIEIVEAPDPDTVAAIDAIGEFVDSSC